MSVQCIAVHRCSECGEEESAERVREVEREITAQIENIYSTDIPALGELFSLVFVKTSKQKCDGQQTRHKKTFIKS